MKTNEKIILYVDGQLDLNEKARFEKELYESPELQMQLENYKNFLKGFDEIRTPEVDEMYFNSIIPRFRENIGNKSFKKFRPVLIFGSAFSTVIIIFFVILMNKSINNNLYYDNTISFNNLNQTELNEYLVNNNYQLLTSNISAKIESQYESIIDREIYDQLHLTDGEKSLINELNNFDYNSIIATVDQNEANIIYENLINKKLF